MLTNGVFSFLYMDCFIHGHAVQLVFRSTLPCLNDNTLGHSFTLAKQIRSIYRPRDRCRNELTVDFCFPSK